jgi:hypothetical protein
MLAVPAQELAHNFQSKNMTSSIKAILAEKKYFLHKAGTSLLQASIIKVQGKGLDNFRRSAGFFQKLNNKLIQKLFKLG